ncbi:MAG: three-Cys-motif partner protein TcmP [Fimbriimonas sp.]
MPKSDINDHFSGPRPEWTARKHALAGRYFVPAAMKMKTINGSVALIDGFAGPNCYSGEITGSTVIMVEAARKVVAQGARAKVYACEPNEERFQALTRNLKEPIDSGLLDAFNTTHAQAVPQIKREIGDAAALVFLDPQTAAEMTLAGDIGPWASRRSTDILGVFMGGDACRVCASLLATNPDSTTMQESLGDAWTSAVTEDAAYQVFMQVLRGRKRFGGLYRLRKQEPKKCAYGIFGLSDSAHGMWLLSEAIAKDWGVLKGYDASRRTPSLFDDVEAEQESEEALSALVSVCKPFIERDASLRGDDLGIEVFKSGFVDTFGKYVAADYTRAAKLIIAQASLRGAHA